MTFRSSTSRSSWAALAAILASAGPAHAAPEKATVTGTSSPLARYQERLEAEADRVFAPEVSGTTKTAIASQGVELWASLTVVEWSGRLLAAAPSLAKAAQVLVRRTEVLWAEERVVDPYASPVFQMASVHALQRGLAHVLSELGVAMPAPAPRSAPRPATPVAAPRPAPAPAPKAAPRAAPVAPPMAVLSPVLSPREIESYREALAQEAFRILSPEFGAAGVVAALSERKANLGRATTVAGWKATLSAGAPALSKAGAVLERRAEVLRGEHGVMDAYESPAVQRAAVKGLEAGLERILAQFGR